MLILNTSHHCAELIQNAWNISALSILALETAQCGCEGAVAAPDATEHALQIVVLLVMVVVPAGLPVGVLEPVQPQGLIALQLHHSEAMGFEHTGAFVSAVVRQIDCHLLTCI